jgi:hypothetical protein
LNIKSNILGKNELKFLCEFLQTDTTLEYLSFSGKKNFKSPSGPELNDIEMMKLFKQSLMNNKKLTYLDFNGTLFYSKYSDEFTTFHKNEIKKISAIALNDFLNDGVWSNKTLKSLILDCKLFYLTSSSVNEDNEQESLDSLGKFIELNTHVQEIYFDADFFNRDFSQQLAFNNHLIFIESHQPLSLYYLERNLMLSKIFKFSTKILGVNNFDIHFHF